jgi:hypothetical protein
MGSSQSSEPSSVEVPDPEVAVDVEVEEDPVDDFLEQSIRWMFGVS